MRARLLAWRQALSEGVRGSGSHAMARRLVAMLASRPPGVLALYWPIRAEPDLLTALDWSAAGWSLALPRVCARDAPLEFGRWAPGEAIVTDRWGIGVPLHFQAVQPQVVVVPCVGFDARGFRLGYGGGYYDRTLARLRVLAIGVAFDGSEITLREHAYDHRLDWIVTESRLVDPSTH